MRSKSLLAVIVSAVSLAITPVFGATTGPSSQPSDQVLAEFPIEHWVELITIPVVWGGKEGRFILDTGCTFTVLDPTEFRNLEPFGKNAHVGTGGGQRTMKMFQPPDLHVGPASLGESGPVVCLDLSDFRAMTGRPIIGVLGVSAIKDSVVQIDFDGRKVRFLRPNDLSHPEWGMALPMQLDAKGCPSVRLVVGGVEGSVEIDTGLDGSIYLPSEAFDHLRDVAKQAVVSSPASTANGIVQLRIMRAPEADLAGYRYHDLIFGETKGTTGLFGLGFLERHLVTLDFPGNRLYLRPGKEFDHRSEKLMSGISPFRIGNQLIAQFVDDGSPAYRAGIRKGDIIIELNGKPASDYEMFEVRDLMRAGDGQEMTVTFRRGDIQQTVEFKLRRAI